MSRRHNLRLIKQHWPYKARELAEALNVSIGTVRAWTSAGLRPQPGAWPYIYAAADIIEFLKRREKPRQPLGPGEIYSVAARRPVVPAGGIVDLVPLSATSAEIVGICPDTDRRIHRRIRISQLKDVLGTLIVRCEDGSAPYSSNGDAARAVHLSKAE